MDGKRPLPGQLAVTQASVLLPIAVVLGVVDRVLGLSVVCGGLVAVIPHLYFSVYAFRDHGSFSAPLVVHSFYRGEVGKFVLTLVGFALVFRFLPEIRAGIVFASFAAMWMLQIWWTAVWTREL